MKNDKPGYISVIKDISGFAGGSAGKLVVIGKEIADCFRNLTTKKQEPLDKVAEKSVKGKAKKKSSKMAKKKTAAKQAELKGKTEKPKSSSGSPSRPKPIAVKTQERQSTVTKKKKSDVKSSGPTAKN